LTEVSLRAVTVEDADLLERWEAPEFTAPFNDFGMPFAPLRDAIERTGLMDDHQGTMLVIADGEPVGTVSWHAVRYGPNAESAAWNIGINLSPPARGRGIGAVAQRQLADRLLSTTPCNRVEASTDVENIAEQRSLEKAGFTRDGVMRGAQFRAGGWHDLVVYSRLQADG
jgi:RimJ/RimL family protein N-acetyltransferase